jgi:hypothetical protein
MAKTADVHSDRHVAKILENAGAVTGRSLRRLLTGCYELGEKNWPPGFREEFERRHGHDPAASTMH